MTNRSDNFSTNLNELLQLSEERILNTHNYTFYMKYLIRERQFTEKFLIQTHNLYESSECIAYQNSLSPYFCFKYLLNNPNDSAEESVSIYDILRYCTETYPHALLKDVMDSYELAMKDSTNIVKENECIVKEKKYK